MPIVFVHGVSNRPGPGFNEAAKQRATFLRETVCRTFLNDPQATILQPIWGGLVPAIPADNPIVPPVNPGAGFAAFGGQQTLGGGAADLQGIALGAAAHPAPDQKVLSVARRSFTEAVDLLWHDAVTLPQVQGFENRERELVAAGALASAYAEEHPQPDWVEAAADDDEFIERLVDELEKWGQQPAPASGLPAVQAFGVTSNVLGWLKGAASKVGQKLVDIPNDALLRAFRPGLTHGLVDFFGDVFFYQTYHGTRQDPGAITQVILDALRQARQEADAKGEPLVVIGHSMGGNILYDVLTHFNVDLAVDALVTVGCQASLFKQLNLFRIQESGAFGAGEKAPKPPKVSRWLNIFDPQDFLSFAFEPEFEGVKDFFFESPGGVLGAHGAYFQRVRFYERLVARLG